MRFRDKLALLPEPSAPAVEAGNRNVLLDELREKMAELLGREPARAPPLADPALSTLPFIEEESEHGRLYVRRERLGHGHHVGRIPLRAAIDASPEMLALLALEPNLAAVRASGALFIDTETTGLRGAGVVAFLVGLLWFDGDGHVVFEQLLLRSPADEKALLVRLAERVEQASFLVSFNGKTFDLPLLGSRRVMQRLPALPPRPHLDLLHVGRRLHKKRIDRCKLIDLESAVLGFERGADIAGADIAAVYGHYLRTGDETALALVVEHNAWDVLSMAALVGLYGEPLDLLHPEDLVGLAATLKRAGAVESAHHVASTALARGAGPQALAVRGQIAKAQGDKAAALRDFEALNAEVDNPAVRLELAKLYEHYVRSPALALALLNRGTSEHPDRASRRKARLEKKLRA